MRLYYLPLILLLMAAAAILAGGSRLARRELTVRVERERGGIRAFAGSMQMELYRLEKLYENHLGRMAREVPTNDTFEVSKACNWLTGVRQISILSAIPLEKDGTGLVRGEKNFDMHVIISNPAGQRLPRPALYQPKDKLAAGQCVVLPDEVLEATVHESGWVAQPGNPTFFWYRRSLERYIVVLVDTASIADGMNRWMRWWVSDSFHPANAGTGRDQIQGPRNSVLAANGEAVKNVQTQPDFVLPMNSRFGSWQILSWDGWEIHRSYHNPTLAVSAALSLLVGLLGVGIFFQQRRAERLAVQRVSFINRVSHELRTPLTNILLNVDLASEAIEENEGPKEAGQRLQLVAEEGRRLGRLIEDVLAFSRKEQGRLKLKPRECWPAEIVKDVLGQFDTALKRRSIEVTLSGDGGESGILDPDALKQILTNLVSNVEKYAADGGMMGIEIRRQAERLTMVVSDQGPGIPSEEAERIFKPFYRLHDSISEGVTGTGLGLSIARDLALQMGGTLRLLPRTRGASFELSVPVMSTGAEGENAKA